MKRILLLSLVLCIGLLGYSQNAPSVSKDLFYKSVATERNLTMENPTNFMKPAANADNIRIFPPSETQIGISYYDLWSNTLYQGRMYRWDDGTMAGVWIYGEEAASFPDRGTGYNFYDGVEWGPQPTERIENRRCGWPSIAPWGDGEVIVSHNGEEGLEITSRPVKGEGDWTQANYLGPAGIENSPTWPRIATSGENNEYIHLIYNSYDEYAGQPTALLYSRSNDGGDTWDPQDVILEGLGADYYTEIGADDYAIVSRNNTVCILIANAWMDLLYMRSDDNGDSWEKNVVWEHPYPFFDWNVTIADTFFCNDNSGYLFIDNEEMVHIVFGLNRVMHLEVGTTYNYFPYVDGIAYWNEDMDPFSNDLDALAGPQYGYANSEMVEDVNYIGYMQDVNGNGTLDLNTDILSYRSLGPSTFPTIDVDDNGDVFVFFASTTEGFENDVYNYKHIWARAYANGEWGEFYDLSSDISHIFDECIYPHLSMSREDASLHYMYMADVTPGLALDDDHGYQENRFIYGTLPKDELIGIDDDNKEIIDDSHVSQNYPNPFTNTSVVNVTLEEPSEIILEVANLMGQIVSRTNHGTLSTGTHPLEIDATNLDSGVYFYTVKAGNSSVTKRMIVE